MSFRNKLLFSTQKTIKFFIESNISCTDSNAFAYLTEPLELPNGTLESVIAYGAGESFNGSTTGCYMYIDDYELEPYNLQINLIRIDNNIKSYQVKETILIPTSTQSVPGYFWNGLELGKIMFDSTDKEIVQIEGTVIF